MWVKERKKKELVNKWVKERENESKKKWVKERKKEKQVNEWMKKENKTMSELKSEWVL